LKLDIHVFPKDGEAKGMIYLDDMLTFKNEQGEFLLIEIKFKDEKLDANVIYNKFGAFYDETKNFDKQTFINSIQIHM
jgi:hypothetical protein